MLSLEAVHEMLIWLLLEAVPAKLDGAEGGTESGVVALAVLEYGLRVLFVSLARTR